MLTMFHAVKGGSGTTVVTALTALAHRGSTLLVDLDDQLAAALGVEPNDRPGVADWLRSDAPLDHLDDLVVEVDATTSLLMTQRSGANSARGSDLSIMSTTRWMQLSSWCRTWATRADGRVFVDCGTRLVPAEFAAACEHRWLVTRACYLSLVEASRRTHGSTGVIVVREPGRTLTDRDIEASVGVPVLASLAWEPTVARSVDAGLVVSRKPHRSTSRELVRLLSSEVTSEVAAA